MPEPADLFDVLRDGIAILAAVLAANAVVGR
jgi:hypothetical protein